MDRLPEKNSQTNIPFLLKEGQKIESQQFKNLLEFMNREEAVKMYSEIKKLEQGELKDSKLRDENGELILVWHGSPRKFSNFKSDAKGEYRWRNKGVHFSSLRKVIEQYAEKAESALGSMLYEIGVEVNGLQDGENLNEIQLKKTYEVYNLIVRDLIEKGDKSSYYHAYESNNIRKPDLDYIKFGNKRFGVDWALEPFGGEMPTNDNTFFDAKIGIYIGNDIGKYEYLGVLNIENPFSTDEATNMDFAFEQGEDSHEKLGTDGTILFHKDEVIGMGNIPIPYTKGTYSAGVFDVNKIKVLGRIEDGKFVKLI